MNERARITTQEASAAEGGGRRKGQLHAEAVIQLRDEIISGELPPGMRLREMQLCERLGVSRTPVREALRTLAAEGLVDLLPNRSVVVSELHTPDLEHLFQAFGAIEGLAAELACKNITNEQIAEIGRMLSDMVDLHANHDRTAYLALNQTIHRKTVECSGNPILQGIWQSLVPRVERARMMPNLDRDRWTQALFEHSKMFAALAARDGPLLAKLTREHFDNAVSYLKRQEPASD